jgi:hypothetical protein
MNLKPYSLLLFMLLPLTVPLPATAQSEKPVYKLGLVLEDEKEKKGGKEKKIDTEVLSAATASFLSARRFKMVERNQLAAVFTEKSLQDFIGGKVNNKLTDVLDLDLVGIVDHAVETSTSKKGETTAKWIIKVRLIDVKTAAILATLTSDRASLLSMLPPTTPKEAGALLAQSIRQSFPPLGYIIQINGKDIVVDLGAEEGLKKGDVLEVVQEQEQIIHPVTGEILPAPLKVIGKLKVVDASPRVSICKRKSGKEMQLSNFVRLKGTESAVVKMLMLLPRIKKEFIKQKEELEIKKK